MEKASTMATRLRPPAPSLSLSFKWGWDLCENCFISMERCRKQSERFLKIVINGLKIMVKWIWKKKNVGNVNQTMAHIVVIYSLSDHLLTFSCFFPSLAFNFQFSWLLPCTFFLFAPNKDRTFYDICSGFHFSYCFMHLLPM